MIDLHSHLLPGIDDGSGDLETSIRMARMAVADGTTIMACTPHICPGVYENRGPDIRAAVDALRLELAERGIALELVCGADVHVMPDMVERLRSGDALSLADSRYVLVEPPHHVCPPNFGGFLFGLVAAGYCPVITHPERLGWIERHYDVFVQAVRGGAMLQITAGSLTGLFGTGARYWSERLLDEGLVHVVASDAHDASRRVPGLSAAAEVIARRLGEEEAMGCVLTRPRFMLQNVSISDMPRPEPRVSDRSAWSKITGWISGRRKAYE